MIFDAFLFFNELELLEIRLHELADVVDRFVIVESTRTFTNLPKPLYFAENRERFAAFHEKIIHLVVDDYSGVDSTNPWAYEHYTRRCMLLGLKECEPDDVILVSDADEIPSAIAVAMHADTPGVKLLEQKVFYFYFNWYAGSGAHTRMLHFRDFLVYGLDPQTLRHCEGAVVNGGGWHFTYLGGVSRIQQKLTAFSHQELNRPEFVNDRHIQWCLNTGTDLFHRASFRLVDLDATFPGYVLRHRERFKALIKER